MSTVFFLGLNPNTFLRQFGGYPQAISDVGGKWIVKGILDFAVSPRASFQRINELSAFMKDRDRSFIRDLREYSRRVPGARHSVRVFGKQITAEDVQRASMFIVTTGDRATTYPIWLGAFAKATTPKEDGGLGMKEKDGIAFADGIVSKTQATANEADINAWQRSEGVERFISMFMSETMRKGARMNYYWQAYRHGKISFGEWFEHAFMEIFGVALLYLAMRAALTASMPDDKDVAWALFDELLGPLPVVNQLVGKMRYGSRMDVAPAFRGFDVAFQPIVDFAYAVTDPGNEKKWTKLVKSSIDAIAFGTGTGNVRRVYETAAKEWPELTSGRSNNPFRLFLKPLGEEGRKK